MRGDWTAATTRTVDLGYDQLLVIEPRPGTRVRVLYGNLWLTEEGASQDVFAGSGAELSLRASGRAIIEGLDRVRVQIVEPVPALQRSFLGLALAWRRGVDWLRSLPQAALRALQA